MSPIWKSTDRCANDRKQTSCRVMPVRWIQRASRAKSAYMSNTCITQSRSRGSREGAHKSAQGNNLTLMSSCVQRRLGAQLTMSSVNRRSTVHGRVEHPRRKEVERASECETRTQKNHTHDTAQRSDGEGETHAHRRGAGLSFARAQACEQMKAYGYQPRTATPAQW
jgi:hypothetical protein